MWSENKSGISVLGILFVHMGIGMVFIGISSNIFIFLKIMIEYDFKTQWFDLIHYVLVLPVLFILFAEFCIDYEYYNLQKLQ